MIVYVCSCYEPYKQELSYIIEYYSKIPNKQFKIVIETESNDVWKPLIKRNPYIQIIPSIDPSFNCIVFSKQTYQDLTKEIEYGKLRMNQEESD